MRFLTFATLPLALTLVANLGGCGDDSSAGGDSDGTGSGTGSTTAAESTGPGTTTGGTSMGTMGGSGDESSTGAPAEETFAGMVLDFQTGEGMPIPDAAISVHDVMGITATSDADGNYEIGPVPLDPLPILLIEPSTDYFGSVRPVREAELNDPMDLDLAQVSQATVQMQIEGLQDQMPAEPDLEQAIIIVRLLNNTATGTTVELDPPPEEGTYYSTDENHAAVLNSSTIGSSLVPVVVYFNVAPGDAGTYTVTATHPERECTVERPDFPTLGGYMTLVEVSCPPPG